MFLSTRWGIVALVAALVLVAMPTLAGDGPAATSDPAAREKALGVLNGLPLAFEVNQGQFDPQVRFLTRGQGYGLFLSHQDAVLLLTPADAGTGKGRSASVRMTFPGSRLAPNLVATDHLPGKANYFIGNDPSKWRTGVSLYAKARYEELYPGIDLVFHGTQGLLEFDFVVKPGADPDAIRLAFSGADKIFVDQGGNLVIRTDAGDVLQHRPVVYQEVDGQRKELAGRFEKLWGNRVRFRVPSYDKARTLVIDPAIQRNFGGYLGGDQQDTGWDVCLDTGGRVILTGDTVLGAMNLRDRYPGSGVPPFGAPQGGVYDAFVSRISGSGGTGTLDYVTYLGGSGSDQGFGVAVDGAANVYVTGRTDSADFPTINALIIPQVPPDPPPVLIYDGRTYQGGASDAFVTMLDAAGFAVRFSTYLGGSGAEWGTSIGATTDAAGINVYAGGIVQSGDFPLSNWTWPPTSGPALPQPVAPYQTALNGPQDAFLTKLHFVESPPLMDMPYSTYFGGSSSEVMTRIKVDNPPAGTNRSVFLAGQSDDSGIVPFPVRNPIQAWQGAADAFLSKLDPLQAGAAGLRFSTFIGGSAADGGPSFYGVGLAVGDWAGTTAPDVLLAGGTYSADFSPLTGALYPTPRGGEDAFMTLFQYTGTAGGGDTYSVTYSTYFGGSGNDEARGAGLDTAGRMYIAGRTSSPDIPTAYPFNPGVLVGPTDGFATCFNPPPIVPPTLPLYYSTYLSGSASDQVNSMNVDPQGYASMTGDTDSGLIPADFMLMNPSPQLVPPSSAFYLKLNLCDLTCNATGPATATVGVAAAFSGEVTSTTCLGSPVFSWDFGDGSVPDPTQNPSHTYVLAGTYTWIFTAQIPGTGASCTSSGTIVVSGGGGTCTLTCTASAPASGAPGIGVDFTSTATATDCFFPPTFSWTFGDGGTSSQQNPQHAYAAAGTYNWQVTVSIIDNSGPIPIGIASCTQNGTIIISACDITCSASGPSSGSVGQTLSFSASASSTICTQPATFSWSFGDGTSSTAQNPTHAYTAAGTWTWTMTANIGGATCVRTGTVTISDCTITCSANVATSFPANSAVTFSATASVNCTGVTLNYTWDFGDGSLGAGATTTHTYTSPGTYNWTLTVTVTGGSTATCVQSGTISITEPTITCSATVPATVLVEIPVNFVGAASVSNCIGTPIYAWTFGDGGTSSLLSPTHTYTTTGTFSWTFTVTCGTEICRQAGLINVCQLACSAAAQPTQGFAPLTVNFATLMQPGCAGTVTYDWYFGDGTAHSAAREVSHTYTAAGVYTWTMTATVNGLVCSETGTIYVCALACTASGPTTGKAGVPVSFSSTSTLTYCAGTPEYSWTFGDGQSSFLQNPTHTYATGGTYVWTLTVREAGATCTRTGTIVIGNPPIVTQIKKRGQPEFQIVIKGRNLQPGVAVYINGVQWYSTTWKSTSKIRLNGGPALKAVAPPNIPLQFTLVNPDGGSWTVVWQYPL